MDNAAVPLLDVGIIGYGPVGALLANLLGQAGLSVLVLERDGTAYPLPRATQFDDEVMRVFQQAGLAEDILPLTRQAIGMRFVDRGGRVLLEWPRPMEVGPQGWHASYRFHQPELDQVLRRGARRWPNVEVRTRCEAYALDEADGGITVRFEDLSSGKLERRFARYVVGCDGGRSLVRRLLGSELVDLGFHERWLVVDCVLKRDRPDLGDYSVQFCDPVRPATYVRGTGNRRRWEVAALPGEDAAELARPETVWRLLSRWITPADAVLERATVYTFHSLIAERWRAGRLMIAGDAAHQSPPFLGQGLCAGMRDVANLAWKLAAVAQGGAPEELLDSYASERLPHVREYIELAVQLGGVINATGTEAALGGRDAAAGPASMSTIKPRLGPGLWHGTSELVGRQAPQPTLADGTRFDEVTGLGFVLVLRRASSLAFARSVSRLREVGVHIVAVAPEPLETWLTEAGEEAAMIRPDRYVMAVAGTESDLEEMVAMILAMITG